MDQRVEARLVRTRLLHSQQCPEEPGRHGIRRHAVGCRDQVARLPGAQRLADASGARGRDAQAGQEGGGLVEVGVDRDDVGGLPGQSARDGKIGEESARAAPVEIRQERRGPAGYRVIVVQALIVIALLGEELIEAQR